MIYFRKYIEAYDSATTELSMEEDGAYDRLLRHYYKTETPIPIGREPQIARAIKPSERKAVVFVLSRFFEKKADGWHNKRADHEIAVSQQARKNGAHGGRPKEETGTITGLITETHESGSTSASVGGSENETGSGQPYKPTSTKSPKTLKPNTSLSTLSNQNPSADASRRGGAAAGATNPTWEAYCSAHEQRYGIAPVRNARVNGQLASLIRCIGAIEAPAVAAFYVGHNRAAYVQAKHATNLLARDAEGLRTEWATNRTVTDTEARQADRTQAIGNAFMPLIQQAKAGA